jgi:hypothetical protein
MTDAVRSPAGPATGRTGALDAGLPAVLARLASAAVAYDSSPRRCGVTGNFGFEMEHFDVSMLVGGQALAPALRQTDSSSVILLDGFSCAMQVKQLDGSRPGRHLAQLLDPGEYAALDFNLCAGHPLATQKRITHEPSVSSLPNFAKGACRRRKGQHEPLH